ncbi:ASCH domain-containing protein [Brevibacterium aurantiacum]|uniref:ASCH domain-containing protein n=1 Tax=Brevibacterium aurantiacum TaxID=273384 RepID=A0A556CF53_BREAU|nr:ASCH domain-containing protein [Brevibacterium aurantiacum]TSI15926.1 ASCH domain-containing protein [Brevibacterium aurantiacum]
MDCDCSWRRVPRDTLRTREVLVGRTLKEWREDHEQFWRCYGQSNRAFSSDMPVVCERFELVFAV